MLIFYLFNVITSWSSHVMSIFSTLNVACIFSNGWKPYSCVNPHSIPVFNLSSSILRKSYNNALIALLLSCSIFFLHPHFKNALIVSLQSASILLSSSLAILLFHFSIGSSTAAIPKDVVEKISIHKPTFALLCLI